MPHYAPAIPLKLPDPEKAEELAEGRKWAWIGTQVPQRSNGKNHLFREDRTLLENCSEVLRNNQRKSGAELIMRKNR